MQQVKVSFLSVNYKQPAVTLDLVSSLERMTYSNWECIVVDNASESQELEQALSEKPQFKCVRSTENLGFAGGNNLGLPLCEGEYIFLINNDTEVPENFLEPILEFASGLDNLGALSPMIRYFDEPQKIQFAGCTEMNKITLRNSGIGDGELDEGQYNKAYPVPFCHGAAMMVPRAVIDKVGEMRDDYFLYYEELDWCERIRQAGYENWFCGYSFLWHKESVSTGRNSPLKTYYLTRNRLLFARRNYGAFTQLLNYLYFGLVALPKNLISFGLKKEFGQARSFWRGYVYNLTHKASDSADRY
ncbi:glycosyltransferase family 2 protein [Croceimicrobium sp.]|uniref:glycosyltransferase family 2 protein n=1 Tax=Croceimicrobium sp. TaxID=2828340 RepID=UPI003BAA8374